MLVKSQFFKASSEYKFFMNFSRRNVLKKFFFLFSKKKVDQFFCAVKLRKIYVEFILILESYGWRYYCSHNISTNYYNINIIFSENKAVSKVFALVVKKIFLLALIVHSLFLVMPFGCP